MNQQQPRKPFNRNKFSGPQGPAQRAGSSRAPVEAGFRIADILGAALRKNEVKR